MQKAYLSIKGGNIYINIRKLEEKMNILILIKKIYIYQTIYFYKKYIINILYFYIKS